MGRPYMCPYCGQSNSIAKGFRRNKTGTVRLRRCKSCGRRWTIKGSQASVEGTPSLATPPSTEVTAAVDSGKCPDPGQVSDQAEPETPCAEPDQSLPQSGEQISRYEGEGKPES